MDVDVLHMVKSYLKYHEYDGLYRPGECGCILNDLAPCGEIQRDCIAGYKQPCVCGNGCDWDVGPKAT
jgi:hypothetical protein